MNDQQNQNEAACGGSALTAVLGTLADQFECHALSRSIDDIEAAGRAMRDAKAEIERYLAGLGDLARYAKHLQARIDAEQIAEWERHQKAVPNA